MPTVDNTQIPGFLNFFSRITDFLQQFVKDAHHTNALLFNLGADISENTKLVGDIENLLFKICKSQGLMGELLGNSEGGFGEVARTPMPEWSLGGEGSGLRARIPEAKAH